MRLVGSSAHAVSCSGSAQVGWGRKRRSGCLSCCVSSSWYLEETNICAMGVYVLLVLVGEWVR